MHAVATLKGQLFDLKQRFVQKMPDRIAAIAETLAHYVEGETQAGDRLERLFHTLAGTAGTYDLRAVAAAAREAEEVCAQHNHASLDRETLSYLAFLVDQLRTALAVDAPALWTARTVLEPAEEQVAAGVSEVSAA